MNEGTKNKIRNKIPELQKEYTKHYVLFVELKRQKKDKNDNKEIIDTSNNKECYNQNMNGVAEGEDVWKWGDVETENNGNHLQNHDIIFNNNNLNNVGNKNNDDDDDFILNEQDKEMVSLSTFL